MLLLLYLWYFSLSKETTRTMAALPWTVRNTASAIAYLLLVRTGCLRWLDFSLHANHECDSNYDSRNQEGLQIGINRRTGADGSFLQDRRQTQAPGRTDVSRCLGRTRADGGDAMNIVGDGDINRDWNPNFLISWCWWRWQSWWPWS